MNLPLRYQETGLQEIAFSQKTIDPKGKDQWVSTRYDTWPRAGLTTRADVATIMQLERILFQDVFLFGSD